MKNKALMSTHLITWYSLLIQLKCYTLRLQFCVAPTNTKMGLFEVGFLALSHLLACIVSFILRIIIKNYLKKKPPGLQSVLDLLIIDLVRVQMFNYAFFMCSLFIGIFHGQLPFFPAQLIIFILQNSDVYVLGLFQCFLVIKAVLIFRGSWMAEVTDSWILRLYR